MTYSEDERRRQILSDTDVERITSELEKRLLSRFYLNVGKGIWGLAWKAILLLLLVLAAYGAFGSIKH